MRVHSALRVPHSALLLVLAACQPQARRLLVIDEQLSGADQLAATAAPWREAGYTVAYRRYYPHLTRADLDDYRVVMVLGGVAPEGTSDALSAGDLTILTEWTLRGGVVVLGYAPAGPGTLDRWLMNRWLAWSGAGIDITAGGLLDATSLAARESGLRGTGFDPFYAGANDALRVNARAQVLARTAAAPRAAAVVAASRTGDGLILVTSRSLLAALGGRDDAGTRAFLVALARWTRRPAEWARIPTAGRRGTLSLLGGPAVPSRRAPALAPPAGVPVETLPPRVAPAAPPEARGGPNRLLPNWIERQGLRVLTGDFPGLAPGRPYAVRTTALDSMLRFMDAGGFNILMTNAHAAAIAESARGLPWEREALRSNWKQLTTRLGSTSIRWVPLATPREFRYAREDSVHCPLDSAFWIEGMSATVRALARLAQQHTDLIPAIGIDLDETTRPWATPTFCDAAWHAAVAVLVRDSVIPRSRARGLDSVPLAVRYDSLLEGGLLASYNTALARAVTERAAGLRADVRRIRRDLLLAVLVSRPPDDWFSVSVLRGLAGPPPEPPVILVSPPRAEALADLNLVAALQLDPLALPAPRAVWRMADGFWLGPAEQLPLGNDSLGRAIRRLAGGRER